MKYPEEHIDQYEKRDWWFLDTNCLSEIVKGYTGGKRATIDAFLRGQHIIIPPTVLSELLQAPQLLKALPKALSATRYTGVTTQTNPFFRRDLFKLLEFKYLDPNVLGLQQLTDEFVTLLVNSDSFRRTVADSNEEINVKYIQKVMPDLTSNLDAVDVYVHAKKVLNDNIASILKIKAANPLPKLPKNPYTFPAIFCFWFAYYHLYLKSNTSKPYANDLNDLAHTLCAPICSRFYTEKRLSTALKQMRKFKVPSERAVAEKVNERVGVSGFASMKESLDNRQRILLPTTQIFSLAELREQCQLT